jgi:hypothetical protein
MSATLAAVRRHRRMKVSEAAAAMDMPLRTYQHFEAGLGRPNLEHLLTFATVTDSDPVGLIAAILLQSPEIAVRSADNKMLSIFLFSVQDFHAAVGERAAGPTAARLIAAFREMFEGLQDELRQGDAAKAWIAARAGGSGRPQGREE